MRRRFCEEAPLLSTVVDPREVLPYCLTEIRIWLFRSRSEVLYSKPIKSWVNLNVTTLWLLRTCRQLLANWGLVARALQYLQVVVFVRILLQEVSYGPLSPMSPSTRMGSAAVPPKFVSVSDNPNL
jgi:hypothetical protein